MTKQERHNASPRVPLAPFSLLERSWPPLSLLPPPLSSPPAQTRFPRWRTRRTPAVRREERERVCVCMCVCVCVRRKRDKLFLPLSLSLSLSRSLFRSLLLRCNTHSLCTYLPTPPLDLTHADPFPRRRDNERRCDPHGQRAPLQPPPGPRQALNRGRGPCKKRARGR